MLQHLHVRAQEVNLNLLIYLTFYVSINHLFVYFSRPNHLLNIINRSLLPNYLVLKLF